MKNADYLQTGPPTCDRRRKESHKHREKDGCGFLSLPGLGVFLAKDSLSWLDDPTSKLGLNADMRTLDRVFPW